MGLILSSSSLIGICCDFLFAKWFPHKSSLFFLKLLFGFAFFFPLSFLFFRTVPAALFGMAIWGVYFEAMVFSNYHAIHESVPHAAHSWAWGISGVLRNIAWAVGPLLASVTYEQQENLPLWVALGTLCFALLTAVVYGMLRAQHKPTDYTPTQVLSRSFSQELGIWKTYGTRIWPLLALAVLFYIIESAFYSVGPLLGEELKSLHPLGGAFVSMYAIPGVVVGFTVVYFSKPFGKKVLSYIGGILAGLGLIAVGIAPAGVGVLLFAFAAAVGLCLLHPALSAVFEDFVARSGSFSNDLVGLTAMAGSLAYVIGPIFNGMLADRFGNQAVFGILGAMLTLYSSLLLFLFRRKVRLPQQQVRELLMISHLKQL